jgi:hypothetical protein
MNSPRSFDNDPVFRAAEDADATLRLVASLPAPEGLEDRVHAALSSAPRAAKVLSWPAKLSPESPWRRSAAAAAIAFVVMGGGWGVYSRVQPNKVIAMPSHISAPGGFSSGGAMRTPQTLNGPVINHPVAPAPAPAVAPAKAVSPQVPQVVEKPRRQAPSAHAASTKPLAVPAK